MSEFIPSTTALDEVLDFLVSTPIPQQIIAFHTSEAAQLRMRYLLDVNRNGALTPDERAELDEASRINQFIILLKARTHRKRRLYPDDTYSPKVSPIYVQ